MVRETLVAFCAFTAAFVGARDAEAEPNGRGLQVPASAPRPAPFYLGYASYGVALTADALIHPGATCALSEPCILGGGGGLSCAAAFVGQAHGTSAVRIKFRERTRQTLPTRDLAAVASRTALHA